MSEQSKTVKVVWVAEGGSFAVKTDANAPLGDMKDTAEDLTFTYILGKVRVSYLSMNGKDPQDPTRITPLRDFPSYSLATEYAQQLFYLETGKAPLVGIDPVTAVRKNMDIPCNMKSDIVLEMQCDASWDGLVLISGSGQIKIHTLDKRVPWDWAPRY